MTELVYDTPIVIKEEASIVKLLDERAAAEGTSRSALVRRGIRWVLFSLPTIPPSEQSPKDQPADVNAA